MRIHHAKCAALALLLPGLACRVAAAADGPDAFPNASPYLVTLIEGAARETLDEQARLPAGADADTVQLFVDSLDRVWPNVVFTAAADAVAAERIRNFDRLLLETTRTDKEVGANASAPGTTSLLEKPSLARLLGLAIEHGGITREDNGTNVTLSTTPYALTFFGFTGEDTAEAYGRYGLLERIGLAATFDTDDSNNDVGGSFEFDTLSQLSVKITPFDRNPRDDSYLELWEETMVPAIEKRLLAWGEAFETVYNRRQGDEELQALDVAQEQTLAALPAALRASDMPQRIQGISSSSSAEDVDAAAKQLTAWALGFVRAEIHDRVRSGEIELGTETRDAIVNELVPSLNVAHEAFGARNEGFRELVEQWRKERPSLAIEYTNNRIDDGSDYSEAKLLFQGAFPSADGTRSVDVLLNGGISFYHDPKDSLHQDPVRDFSVSLGVEGSFPNWLFGRFDENNADPMTFSFSGKYSRLEENNADVGVFQLKTGIPLSAGFSLPFALTYNTRTEEDDDDEFRVNLGLSLDTDKLAALWRMAGMR